MSSNMKFKVEFQKDYNCCVTVSSSSENCSIGFKYGDDSFAYPEDLIISLLEPFIKNGDDCKEIASYIIENRPKE